MGAIFFPQQSTLADRLAPRRTPSALPLVRSSARLRNLAHECESLSPRRTEISSALRMSRSRTHASCVFTTQLSVLTRKVRGGPVFSRSSTTPPKLDGGVSTSREKWPQGNVLVTLYTHW